MFYVGRATSLAIHRLAQGINPVLAGETDETANGNGALMRILPLLLYINDKNIDQRFLIVKDVSSLTHSHIRSVLSCFIYLELARELLTGNNIVAAYRNTCTTINTFLDETATCTNAERVLFDRVLSGNIATVFESTICASGYVLHTLEASIWCLLTTMSYKKPY